MTEYNNINAPTHGFSLVELSIVLVILGLLTGGILAGQSLIRASELRAVTTEYQRYVAATNTFRDKYFALPGDIANASSIWSTLAAGNNGNGDGNLDKSAAVSTTGEIFQFWNELALAGLVEGKYTGIAGAASINDTLPGTNSPKSKLNNAGWSVENLSNASGDNFYYQFDYGNAMIFGGTSSGDVTLGHVLKPEEAWNIDTKLDDGNPGSGKILTHSLNAFGAATACTLGASKTDYTSGYNLANSAQSCALIIAKPF